MLLDSRIRMIGVGLSDWSIRESRIAARDHISQFFMSAYDDPLSVAMRVLPVLSAVVENGYD